MEGKINFLVKLMKKSIKFFLIMLYIIFIIALSFGPVVAGIWTLLPAEAFGWQVARISYLGYHSTCSFAPFSTIILFVMSFIGFVLLINLRKYLVRKAKSSVIFLKFKTLVTQK